MLLLLLQPIFSASSQKTKQYEGYVGQLIAIKTATACILLQIAQAKSAFPKFHLVARGRGS